MAEASKLRDDPYLKEHYILNYLEDAITQFLIYRVEDPTTTPANFFKDYFASAHRGSHVLFREFAFVNETPYNRLCVLKMLLKIFKPFLFKTEYKFDINEYHAIVNLVIQQFPMRAVEEAFACSDTHKKDNMNRMKLIDFIRGLLYSFCTGLFDFECTIVQKELEENIEFYTKLNVESESAESFKLKKADFLNNEDMITDNSFASAMNKIIDGTEFARILNLNDSSDEERSEMSQASSVSTFGDSKIQPEAAIMSKIRVLRKSASFTIQTRKDDAKKDTGRRAKSAVAIQRRQKTP